MARAIYFDTETTGTRAGFDRIVELAAFDPVNNRSFVRLVNPGIPIPQEVINIHKITDAMVQDAPSFKEVMSEFLDFCEGDVALVAHNLINFDLPFLQGECKRVGLSLPSHWIYIDTLIWARKYRKDLPRHSLQYLRQMYGAPANQAHRALDDVITLHTVFQAMIDDLSIDQVAKLLEKSQKTEKTDTAKPQEVALSLF